MSLVNLHEGFLYERLPVGLIQLDERALIQSVVGGFQDRLEDLRSYSKKFQLFFSPVGLPEAGPNVVFVDLTTSGGRVVTRSLDLTSTTPVDPVKLLNWAADQLHVGASCLANPRLGTDLLRFVDANIIDYIASTLGAVLYQSAVAAQQPTVISDSGTFTAAQLAHQNLIGTYFPRLKFKGTTRSFDALGKLLGFDDVRMVPLWSRVSPRLPNDPGTPANDADYREVPEYFPQQDLDPFYDPLQQRDGPYFHWFGTVANGTAATNFYPQVINGYQPWVKFLEDGYGIANGTLTQALSGTYLLGGGSPHFKASISLPSTGTFYALGEGESWNGIGISVTDLGGTLRRLDITDRLSAIKYRSSFYNLGITMATDKAEEIFGTLAMRTNKDVAVSPHAYISFSGALYGTSPYRPFGGGEASFQNTTGIQTSDFLTPFAGTVAAYTERYETGLATSQENFSALAKAGQGVTQALEEVRAATRFPRRASYGYLQDDTVRYAPILGHVVLPVTAHTGAYTGYGVFSDRPIVPYRTGISIHVGGGTYYSKDTLSSDHPGSIYHSISSEKPPFFYLTATTVPSTGAYSVVLRGSPGPVYVEFYGTIGENNYPDTSEVVRLDADAPVTNRRYMPRPEDDFDDDHQFETMDEYPYRRDILGGGELVETDFVTTSGTNFAEYSMLEQTMAVKAQTGIDHDVYVAYSAFPVPQFVIRPRPLPYKPGQRATCFQGQFRDQASLTAEDLDTFANSGGRTQYFHSELDNVFQPGYQIYHAGLVSGVLVADPDKFNGAHHLASLVGWLPLNEHPEGPMVVSDVVANLASQSLNGFLPQDRVWDSQQGFNLTVTPGSGLVSSGFRDCTNDITLSFWLKLAATAPDPERILTFGSISAYVARGALTFCADSPARMQVAPTFGVSGWVFVYVKKTADTVLAGVGSLASEVVELANNGPLGLTPNTGNDLLAFQGASHPYQIRDVRIWNCAKTQAEMELVRQHQPKSTAVPYRIGHVLSLNTGDRYGLQVLPTGWLALASMPAWVRSPKYAKIVRYDGAGEYNGEAYRRELGLGGGRILPTPWKLGEQFYSLTADGTVVVSPQLGAMPGSNAVWQGETAPGYYLVLNGSTAQGSVAVVTASGGGSSPWSNCMEATNPVRDTLWLTSSAGTLYSARLVAVGSGAQFVTTASYESNQQQGDAASTLTVAGAYPDGRILTVSDAGVVTQSVYSGTVTTPPLYMYLHDTLLEDTGADILSRWTDPTGFGLRNGFPVLQAASQLGFTNSSTLLAGTYRLTVDLGNLGRVDADFDGFRLDITVADTSFNKTMLAGYNGSDFRGFDTLDFTLDHAVEGGWILTFGWLNSFSNPARGQIRQLAVYGYTLQRLETSLYEVQLTGAGALPSLAKLSIQEPYDGSVPGSWLSEVNSYGTTSVAVHEGMAYPENDTLRSRYPLANLLTGVTAERREDVIARENFCLPDPVKPPILLEYLPNLAGVVSDSSTGVPIQGAIVGLHDSSGMTSTTVCDAGGNYVFEYLPLGAASVTASYAGYSSVTATPTISPGANTQNLALAALTSLHGRVTRSDTGAPLSGVAVTADEGIIPAIAATTDVNGYYSILGLVLHTSSVTFIVTGYATQTFTRTIVAGLNTLDAVMVPSMVTVSGEVSPAGWAAISGLGSYVSGSTVTLSAIPGSYGAAGYVDVVFIVDESGSMSTEHYWLGTPVPAGVTYREMLVGNTYKVVAATVGEVGTGIIYNSTSYADGDDVTCVTGRLYYTQNTPGSGGYRSLLVLKACVPTLLEDALAAANVGMGANKNHYAIVGFGRGTGSSTTPRTVCNFTTAALVEQGARALVITGSYEDGYAGMSYALNHLAGSRPGAVKVFILVTDEGRDITAGITKETVLAELRANHVLLSACLDVRITNSTSNPAAAVGRLPSSLGLLNGHIQNGIAVLPDGSGGYTTAAMPLELYVTSYSTLYLQNGVTGGASGKNSLVDYGEVVEVVPAAGAHAGSIWDLEKLRQGGNFAESFTAGFIAAIGSQISYTLNHSFDHWVINGTSYGTNPVSFVVSSSTVAYLYMV